MTFLRFFFFVIFIAPKHMFQILIAMSVKGALLTTHNVVLLTTHNVVLLTTHNVVLLTTHNVYFGTKVTKVTF